MAVKIAGLRQFFLPLRRHFRGIGRTRLPARAELATRHLIFGLTFFFFALVVGHDQSEWPVGAAEEPAQPERNGNRGIGLRLDGVADRALE